MKQNNQLVPVVEHQSEQWKENYALQVWVRLYFVIWLVSAVDPVDRSDWMIENLLVFVLWGLCVCSYRKFRLSTTAYFCILLFLSLHAVGAHYAYVDTPFGEWMKQLFAWSRNHYDRIVHFSFGFCFSLPLWEVLRHLLYMKCRIAYMMTTACMMCFAAVYEIIEAWVAQIVSPELGNAFLGTQGDIWDTQRDMEVTLYGTLIALLLMSLKRTIKTKKN